MSAPTNEKAARLTKDEALQALVDGGVGHIKVSDGVKAARAIQQACANKWGVCLKPMKPGVAA
jgi:hypothetical protein